MQSVTQKCGRTMKNHLKQIIDKIASEPFRLFFVIGVLCASIGVLYWPIKVFSLGLESLSSKVHVHLQMFGFLLAFIIGFLTTAVPRLTQSGTLSIAELTVLIFDFIILQVVIFKENYILMHMCFVVTLLSLMLILGRRFINRKRNPPQTFIFIPFAFLSALTGSVLNIISGIRGLPLIQGDFELGNRLVFQAFIMFLLLGVGGFLIRSILGWAPPLPESTTQPLLLPKEKKWPFRVFLVSSVVVFLSFWIESLESRLIRAILITAIVLFQMKIHRKSNSGKLTAYTLQASLWMLIFGCWSVVFAPVEYGVDLMHFAFIGGFSLSTLAVATRVILSHCNYSKLLLGTYWPFSLAVILMLCGLLTRVSVIFLPDFYYHHIAYASGLWLIGLWVWSASILTKCLRDTIASV